MATFTFEISGSPHATAYDADNPTRSTENYSNAMHNILQDMDDNGSWQFSDNIPSSGYRTAERAYCFGVAEDVFDYAEQAIENHRAEEEISITKPIVTSLVTPPEMGCTEHNVMLAKVYDQGMRMLFLIYYMWKTETDPLLLKEKLQELLIAWPLLETTVELADDLGQQFKIYPSWKNADL